METISERFYNESQSWFYERTVANGSERFRVFIRRNSHDDQSFIRGYALDRLHCQWNVIVDKPIKQSPCREVSYVMRDAVPTLFKKEADAVLSELRSIFAA